VIAKRQRLDVFLTEHGLAPSRQRARALIMAGSIRVNDQPVDKPGALVDDGDRIALTGADLPYVSRGGLKLEAALTGYRIDAAGRVCLDVGASTGGFTDCLLQRGASRVYAVDVGYGQMAWKLRQDPRVIVIERTNIRYMSPDALPEPVDLVTIDASFISLKIVVPAVLRFLKPEGMLLSLIKPQFEVGKGLVGKGGVVSDPARHAQVIDELGCFFAGLGLRCSEALPSPVLGPKGNREFFMLLKREQSSRLK
jgi:23S rRNA (cytidine1920-2'-O)/16S rRNA (cytidine1409-2'-O)-methyltransferase